MADPGFARGGTMASARSASRGGLGAEPQRGPGAEHRGRAPGGGKGAKPPEAESFLCIFIQKVAKS